MSQHAWFEHFKEQLQGLNLAFEQSGSPLSLLGYALEEKRISSEDYLSWAVTHFNLPKLQSRFFTETPLSQEMFAKWATHYRWSAECLPVAEWDGSLIVACLQPPQDFPTNPSCILVLTDYESLSSSWTLLHPARQAPAAIVADTPEGMDFSVATVTKQHSDGFSFEDLNLNESSDTSSESSFDSDVISELTAANDRLDGLLEVPTLVRLESLNSEDRTIVKPDTNVLEVSSNSLHTESSVDEIAVEPVAPILEQTSASPLAANPVIPPPPEDSVVASVDLPPPFEDSFTNKAIPIIPRPAGVAKPTINPVASGHFALEKLKKKNSALLNEKIKLVLSEMKAHFAKSMILTLDDEESQMTAFAWDENFQGITDTARRFPLKTPSIFNIVVSTQKSFHGYISINELNEKFFEEWNKGQIPDHVTVSPIIVNEKIVGLLMGFAEKSAYNKVSLNLAEKLSTDFVKGLAA